MLRTPSLWAMSIVLPLVFGSGPRTLDAQASTGEIRGVVRTVEGQPVNGAQVVVEGTGLGVRSTTDGEFVITSVPMGKQTITARLIGFTPVSQQISIFADRSNRLEITLSASKLALGTIRVLGLRAYGANTSNSALKTGARVLDVPQSVVAISHEFIQDQNAATLTDLLRNVAGVTPFSDYQDFMARGFREGEDEVTTDGVRSNGNNFFSTPNLNNVESVEILKGPQSVLYGALEGGAMINLVTKHPRAIASRVVSLTGGSYSDYQATIDLTGPLGTDPHLLYRLNANIGDVGSFRRFQSQRIWGAAPSFSWVPNSSTTLTILGDVEHQFNYGQRNRGIAAPNGDLNVLPLSWTANEPTDFSRQNAASGGIELVQNLFSGWKATTTARYAYSDFLNKYHEPLGMSTVNGQLVMLRQYRNQDFSWKSTGITTNAGGDVKLGSITNNILLDADLTVKKRLTSPSDYANNAPPLNVYQPVYGLVNLASYVGAAPANAPFARDYRDWGVGAQDVITLIPQVKVVLGGRYSNYFVKNATYSTGAYNHQNLTATTYKVGLVYEPVSWISFFGDMNQGFLPQTAADTAQGGPFAPLTTKQAEGGIKLGLFNERLMVTSDVYDILKHNVLVPDPTNSAALLPVGGVTSKGFETDIVGSITPEWSVTANYAYNDTKVTQDTRPGQLGTRFPGAPPDAASVWTRYDIRELNLGFALGGSHVAARNTFDATILPAYTVLDGGLYYRWEKYNFQLNVKNLLDDRYFQGGYFNYQLYPGNPREVELTVRTTF